MKLTLRVEQLIKIYNKRTVVNKVSLYVNQGEIVGLLGPNGAGKTTTFYMITGMIRPNNGSIYLDGQEITNFAMYKRARMGIGYLSQEASIFRKLTVEENIMAILETMPLSRQDRRLRLEELLNELDISHLGKNKAFTLSGGERRRVVKKESVSSLRIIMYMKPFQ